jgi:nucleotide-binding universal stress UspA family protein
MGKVLVAVNENKSSRAATMKFVNMLSWCKPKTIILLYVEKYNASFIMDEMAGDSELSALKEALKGSEYQEALDKKAQKVINYYKKAFEDKGIEDIKAITRIGHPAEEIVNTAKEEGAELIVMGSRGKKFAPLLMGSVSREVVNSIDIPVLLAK